MGDENVINTLDWNFFEQLKLGENIDETCFYFCDDPQEEEHYIGFLPKFEQPYWAGYCDVENGCEFSTAEELANAKIYKGKSLKERWESVRIVSIWGAGLDCWLESNKFKF